MPGDDSQALAVREAELTIAEPIASRAMTVAGVLAHVSLVREVLEKVMKDETHYGVIPGTDKPTLYQPGAQTLMLTFRLRPSFDVTERLLDGDHREYFVKTTITDAAGAFIANGVGSCTTKESKYRYRRGDDYTDTGHPVPQAYWNKKPAERKRALVQIMDDASGNYGVKKVKVTNDAKETKLEWHVVEFPKDATMAENPNIADTYNTVLKMAKKRSLVDGALNATAASDIFTQDMEELTENLASLQAATGQDLEGETLQKKPAETAPREAHNATATAPTTAGTNKPAIPMPDWRNVRVHIGRSRVVGKKLGELNFAAIEALKTGWIDKTPATEFDSEDRRLAKAVLSAIIENDLLGKAPTLKDEQAASAAGPSAGDEAPEATDTPPAEGGGQGEAPSAGNGAELLLNQIKYKLASHEVELGDLMEELRKRHLIAKDCDDLRELDDPSLDALNIQLLGFLREWGYVNEPAP